MANENINVSELPEGFTVEVVDGVYVATNEETGEQFYLDADQNGEPDEEGDAVEFYEGIEDEDEPGEPEMPVSSEVKPMAMISEEEEQEKLQKMQEHMPLGAVGNGNDKALAPDHDYSWKGAVNDAGQKAVRAGNAALEGFEMARQSRAGQMAGKAIRKGRAGAGRVAVNVAKNSKIEAGSYERGGQQAWGQNPVDSLFATQQSRENRSTELFSFQNREKGPSDFLNSLGGVGKPVDSLFGFSGNGGGNPFGFGGAGKGNPFGGSPVKSIEKGDNPFGFGRKGKLL